MQMQSEQCEGMNMKFKFAIKYRTGCLSKFL
jgi:hypothetical protein